MSTVTEKIRSLGPGEKFVSFEFFPPKTEGGFRNLLARLNRMLALNPLFVTITWGASGSTSEKSLDLAAVCLKHLGLTTVLHLTCTNTNREIIDNALEAAKKSGIKNILALRGDPPRTQEYWTPNCDFVNAVDLVKYIREKYGDYFCIGVAGYPEGHIDSADSTDQCPEKDMPYLVEKVKAGADFIITQLFFDAEKFLHYEKLLRSYPDLNDTILIPGLMPVNTYEVLLRSTKLSHASIPQRIRSRLEEVRNDDDKVKNLGVEIITSLIDEIDKESDGRVKGYHFYCLNLEKAVASIMLQSTILRPIMEKESAQGMKESAIASDSDSETEIVSNGKGRRRSSIVNENKLADASNGKLLLTKKALNEDKKALFDISTGKGSLGKDAIWDDFPNGRFSDSNSPAYGQIDGYGPSLKVHSPEEAIKKWGLPLNVEDIEKLFIDYLSSKLDSLPWVDTDLSTETTLIQEELFCLIEKGWFTTASQPAVCGCPSNDRIFGWGPSNGIVFQKAFVEFFIPKAEWKDIVLPKLKKYVDGETITFYVGDLKSKIDCSLEESQKYHRNAVTWGVFPLKEILQTTNIDYQSFNAWNEEAFHLWQDWSRCFKIESKSYKLLKSIQDDYYLVCLIHHDFKNEHGLWDILLD